MKEKYPVETSAYWLSQWIICKLSYYSASEQRSRQRQLDTARSLIKHYKDVWFRNFRETE